MRKFWLVILMLLPLTISAQNIQFITDVETNFATFEIYKPIDNFTLYYFTDFKMNKNGYSEAYSEISLYYNINDIISPTIQYNAGLNKQFYIPPVYMAGISKAFTIKETFNLTFDVLFRYQKKLILPNDEMTLGYQLIACFSQDFKRIQYSGYCDFWNLKYYVFEPQIWYKFSKRIYAGAEMRLSNYSPLEDYQNYLMLGVKFNLENLN